MKRFFAITAALAGVIALACAVLRRNGALQGCSFEDNGWQEERQKEQFKR